VHATVGDYTARSRKFASFVGHERHKFFRVNLNICMYVLLLNKILRIAHEIKHKKHIHTYSKFIQKNISRKIEKTLTYYIISKSLS
jgi:uncharacterized membrane protein YkvI